MHNHRREDESFYILEGELTFFTPGKKFTAGPGTFVQNPRDIPHTFKNEGTVPARYLVYAMPSGFEKFVMEAGTLLPSADSAPLPMTPAVIEKLLATAPKYGIEILPPG